MKDIERVVVWFSAGVTSAVAAKLTLDKYAATLPVHVVICDTGSEDVDNWRFTDDISGWLGVPIERLKNDKYTDTIDVYLKERFIVGPYGARCTTELKKRPRREYENLSTDLQIFGFDADERHRAERFAANNPEVRAWFPLIEHGITKRGAREMLLKAGITEPRTYAEGFNNANCLATGCVKGGAGYWNHIRRMRPAVFDRMAKVERDIGHAIIRLNGEPVYLDELPENAGNHKSEPAIQCGLFCGEL
jgi:3'-phosphoadenosine 5'-phosphosulfate sulfotransferase (PAPS reductase)/FAD synthetase